MSNVGETKELNKIEYIEYLVGFQPRETQTSLVAYRIQPDDLISDAKQFFDLFCRCLTSQ